MKPGIFKPKRGMVQPRAAAYYLAAVERELTVRELRLLPLIQYSVMNGGSLKADQINSEEREILESLAAARWLVFERSIAVNGYIVGVSDAFWNHMNYVLFICYAVQICLIEDDQNA